MDYNSFMNQRNRLNNLYNVVRKSDGKELLRGASYNSVIDLIRDMKGQVDIYFY